MLCTLLDILALSAKRIHDGRISKYFVKLAIIGVTENAKESTLIAHCWDAIPRLMQPLQNLINSLRASYL
jgi:uncharacterized membrane protein YhaH (DUF805 family)